MAERIRSGSIGPNEGTTRAPTGRETGAQREPWRTNNSLNGFKPKRTHDPPRLPDDVWMHIFTMVTADARKQSMVGPN